MPGAAHPQIDRLFLCFPEGLLRTIAREPAALENEYDARDPWVRHAPSDYTDNDASDGRPGDQRPQHTAFWSMLAIALVTFAGLGGMLGVMASIG